MVVNLADIEKNLLDRLAKKGLKVKSLISKKKTSHTVPVVYAAVEEGSFKRITKTTFKQDVTVYLSIEFQHRNSEEDRRKGIFPILSGVIGILLLQDLDLKIDPLEPGRFQNVTDDSDAVAGKVVFMLTIKTGFNITKMDDDEVAENMLTVGLEYFSDGDTTRDPADTSDDVTIES